MYSELTKMEGKRIVIRTFGYFDIFVDGETIPFSCKKAKELLALLVDRRGGFVTRSVIYGRMNVQKKE